MQFSKRFGLERLDVTFVGVQLLRLTSSVGVDTNAQQYIAGQFDDVALAPDLVITLSSAQPHLVEIWPCHGPAHCLLRIGHDLDVRGLFVCGATHVLDTQQVLDSLSTLAEGHGGNEAHNDDEGFADPGDANQVPANDFGQGEVPENDVRFGRDADVAHALQGTDTDSTGLSGIDEVPARVHPEEAAEIAEQLWASSVERLVASSSRRGQSADPGTGSQRAITLLTFGRHPRDLEDALLASAPAQSARDRGIDIQPAWANGAKIFVDDVGPEHFEAPLLDDDLKPYHVVVQREDEDQVIAALSHLPYGIRKLKAGRERVAVPSRLSMLHVSPNGESTVSNEESSKGENASSHDAFPIIEYSVKNTFVHIQSSVASGSSDSFKTV